MSTTHHDYKLLPSQHHAMIHCGCISLLHFQSLLQFSYTKYDRKWRAARPRRERAGVASLPIYLPPHNSLVHWLCPPRYNTVRNDMTFSVTVPSFFCTFWVLLLLLLSCWLILSENRRRVWTEFSLFVESCSSTSFASSSHLNREDHFHLIYTFTITFPLALLFWLWK